MSTPAPNQRIGPYELTWAHQESGMGEVWKGRHTRFNRDVATKFSRAQFPDRFARKGSTVLNTSRPSAIGEDDYPCRCPEVNLRMEHFPCLRKDCTSLLYAA
jgi:hypothetical protein